MGRIEPILFAAELGGGFGHVRRLLPVALAARRRGLQPVFAVGNSQEVAPLLRAAGFDVRRAPTAGLRPTTTPSRGSLATGFADILGGVGFAEPRLLHEAVRAWEQWLEELAPLAIVCEFSPFLALAAHGGPTPLLSLGHGFALPPPHLPQFPRLLPDRALYAEAELLTNANDVCRSRGRPTLRALPALLAGAAHAVTGLAFLDPYEALRESPAVGPPALDVSFTSAEPTEDVFAYLFGGAPSCHSMLRALSSSGLSGRVFVRQARPGQREVAATGAVVWEEHPLPMQQAIDRARVVVHHGSMCTAEDAAVGGRYQVVVPLYLEHLLTARALAAHGLASVVRPGTGASDAVSLLSRAVSIAPGVVSSFAERLSTPPTDLPDRLLDNVLD